MLDHDILDQLKSYLTNLKRPLILTANIHNATLAESETAKNMLAMLEQIKGLSNLITVEVIDDASIRQATFHVSSPDYPAQIHFAGLPLGHEFTSMVLALLHVGGHPTKLDEETIEQIKNLPSGLTFETFYSQSCQNCPDVVQALNLIAALNTNIKHTAIDGASYQDEVESRQIMSVPAVYLNGELFLQGRSSLKEILAKLDTGAIAREAEKLAKKDTFDMLVIGAGPAGSAAAIYAARKGIKTGVLAERLGGQVMDTMAIENFISVPYTEGPKLVAAAEMHMREYDIDIMTGQKAKRIERKEDGLILITLENEVTLKSKSVVLATGARWRLMNVPGEDEYRNRGVAFCPHCDGPLFKNKPIAVIGGGNSGIEAAIDLAGIALHVTVLEFSDTLRADKVLQDKVASLSNVTIIKSAQTTEVLGDGNKVTGLNYTDRLTNQSHHLALDGIFVQIGLLPNTEWLKGDIELNKMGEIITNNHQATSIPGVFAAGDATDVPYKQIIISMGEGAKASLGAFDYLIRNS
ncbi:alkyl hydroperoxide reductase subunit F [Thorsellia anophelis]|uniref:Alkyl hydroperoxide reductase subunit F n=1 Tax=Thorsellia anophelis DSM 18579 TaxID=1123402 RepID=A0A1H9ZSE1_9GAMM|nr:alkyl hydroperoxide reductase subunit F [Thorsellia anophelis]SES84622.1 alkyl hydroperoxide reductase subunit F [Thorsellia anophelis DSM 18579]